MKSTFNPRLAKMHRCYTTDEVAALYGVHRATVRAWIKDGLEVLADQKPFLIPGLCLREYLTKKRIKRKCKTQAHEMYCLPCRKPQLPAGGMVDYQRMQEGRGRLIGICPSCDSLLNKFSTDAVVASLAGKLEVSFTGAEKHISDSTNPPVNLHFNKGQDQ